MQSFTGTRGVAAGWTVGHVRPTFARGCSWDWCKSSEFLLVEGRGSVRFGAWLASRFRPLISMTMLHVTMLQVTIILYYTFSFWQMYHIYLGFREFAKYEEWGKFSAFVGHPKAKRFSAPGATPLLRSTEPWLWGCLGSPFTKTSSGHSEDNSVITCAVNSLPLSDRKTCGAPKSRNMNSSSWANVSSGVPNMTSWQRSVLLHIGAVLIPVLFANTGPAWALHMIFNKITVINTPPVNTPFRGPLCKRCYHKTCTPIGQYCLSCPVRYCTVNAYSAEYAPIQTNAMGW